ncbi:LLM class flavin-dependent oxidoreductase [Rhodococcus sp. NPDC057529]|uniref:LLM class flavin-dependent oxidoreductase n=1 Tax=Rhodococcus sp. NPDC057529 TaxID=3346158 RepID=UPI00366D8A36
MHEIEFFSFLESGYPRIPYAGQRPSKAVYIDLPNSNYDPIEGQRAIENQLEMLVRMEDFGFDGVSFSEQHNGPIGLGPNAMLVAAWLASNTNRVKIWANGPLMNAYQTPIRLAEEIAWVDTVSRGRLMVGLPMGLGAQYHSLNINPALARERHAEGHDLLVKALDEPGPFTWRGKHFNHNYVNLWPRPAHKIDFVLPGGGSIETLELAAKRRYTYQTVLNYRPAMIQIIDKFRNLCREEGYDVDPKQIATVVEVHVAETDAIARQESEASILWNYQNYFQHPEHESFPAGYSSERSMRSIRTQGFAVDTKKMSFDDLRKHNWIIAGSPETVIEGLEQLIDDTGTGRILLNFSTGAKPRWLIEKTAGLFAEQVLPHFRRQAGQVVDTTPPGFGTASEYAVRRNASAPNPTIVREGYLRDVHRDRWDPEGAKIEPWHEPAPAGGR